MCVIQDDIKVAYLRHANVMNQQQLDARLSDADLQAHLSSLQIGGMMNHSTPLHQRLSHKDFSTVIDCSHSTVSMLTPATPQKVEDCFALIRANLRQMITNWEQSGQGDAGHHGEESDGEGLCIQMRMPSIAPAQQSKSVTETSRKP
jgi:hypothetical protein